MFNKRIITSLILLLFLFLFSKIAFAVWDELPYDPGETDNPECLPSQTDCDVYPAIITETDPVFIATEAFTITGADTINWDTAYSWGDHASAGYVTGTPWTLLGYITDGNTGWDNSYGFITSYTETDPLFTASTWDTTTNNSANWDIAYGWGDHSTAGYLTSASISGLVPYTGGTSDVNLGVHNFTIDTNTLFVDSVNHRVGIGTIIPNYKLEIQNNDLKTDPTSTLVLSNITDSDAVNTVQVSPSLTLRGSSWNTGTLSSDQSFFRMYAKPSTGPTTYDQLYIDYSTNGTAWSNAFYFQAGWLIMPYGVSIQYGQIDRISPRSDSADLSLSVRSTTAGKSILFGAGTYVAPLTEEWARFQGGKFGIGTNSPTNLLSLGGTTARTIWMERNTTAATAGQGLTLHSGGAIAGTADLAGGDLTLSSGISTGTGTSSIHFFTATAGATGTTDRTPTEKMTILGSGNVGIGTTSPSSKLDVTTNSLGVTQTTTSGLALINTTAAALDTQQMSPAIRWSGYGWGTTAGASQAINFRAFVMPVQGPTVEGYLSFGSSVADGAYSDGQMVLTNNGNLGVGTTSPTKKVEITNNSTTMSSLTFYSDAWGGRIGTKIGNGSASALYLEPENGDVRLYVSGIDSKLIGYNGSGNTSFSFNTNGDSYLSAIAGNVGIRQTSPGYLLHVGSASVTDATVLLRLQDADSTCDLNANTGAPTCGSDETLKKNINNQSDNLSKIIALRPVTYNWLTDLDGVEIKHGFIAQEVAEVMPELVTDGIWIDGTTKKFLQTSGMTPYIVGAIKEMNLKLLDLNNFEKENDWRDSLVAWLANAENRITRIFTGEICLTEAGEETVCLNRIELQSLKALLNNSSTNTATSTTTTITTTDNNDGSIPMPTCSDGVKNQDETDIDIGGVCTQVEEQEELVDEPDVVSETVITEEENVLEEEIPDEETLEPDVTTEVEEVVPATDEEEADQITNDDESSL